jgi:hypothetical protein
MTCLKELARMKAAILQRNEPDLRWALGYCKMRLSISARKEHLKYWKEMEEKVIQAHENSK